MRGGRRNEAANERKKYEGDAAKEKDALVDDHNDEHGASPFKDNTNRPRRQTKVHSQCCIEGTPIYPNTTRRLYCKLLKRK